MNQTARQVLALFVHARRKYASPVVITPRQLAALTGVRIAQINAVERQQNITHECAVKLAAWCGLQWDGEGWQASDLPQAIHWSINR